MRDVYYRPLAQTGSPRPRAARSLAGGSCWFTHVEAITRRGATFLAAAELDDSTLERLCAPRATICGLGMGQPHIMGILNVTPDSFSDGGDFAAVETAVAHARRMAADGASILDIGGESTRPGADVVDQAEEIRRTAPVIAALRSQLQTPISIDTRKGPVAEAALTSGADMVNDVAAMTYDPATGEAAAGRGAPICLMHAQGTPDVMQNQPTYANVLLDVFDFLEERVNAARAAGVPSGQIIVDPGIGFGKTLEHNLALIAGLSLFHDLGCPVLLGASRKRFIGTITGTEEAKARLPGSLALALAGAAQGVQILRVHDVAETEQALKMAAALAG